MRHAATLSLYRGSIKVFRRGGAGSIPRFSLAACRGMLEDKRTGVVRPSLAGTIFILPARCRRVKRPMMLPASSIWRHRRIERGAQVQLSQYLLSRTVEAELGRYAAGQIEAPAQPIGWAAGCDSFACPHHPAILWHANNHSPVRAVAYLPVRVNSSQRPSLV